LKLAVRQGDIIAVRLLLKYGAGPNAGLSQALIDQANKARDLEIAEMLESALERHQEG
jgi:ankyrin repeat protein